MENAQGASLASAQGAAHSRAMIMLIAGGIAIGGSPIFVRLSELGPITTSFWRLALAVLPFLLFGGRESPASQDTRPRDLMDCLRLAVPGIFIAADLGAWHLSLHLTSVANATLLMNLAPIFVSLGGWFLFKTRITRSLAIGLAIAVAGVAILKGGSGEWSSAQFSGDFIAILAAAFYAGYILSVGHLRSRFSTRCIMLWSTAIAAVITLPAAYISEGNVMPLTVHDWLVLAGLAWITHAAGQSMIAYALAYLPASFSSLTLMVQPVMAALLAWIFLAEPLDFMQAVGGATVVLGILIARRG